MEMLADVRRRGLERSFLGWTLEEAAAAGAGDPP
jgi:hypothetical protein